MHWKSVMLEKVWLSYAHDKTHTDEGWVPHIHTYTLTHSRYSHMCVSYDLAKILIFRTWQKKWYKCRVRASPWSYFFKWKKKPEDFFSLNAPLTQVHGHKKSSMAKKPINIRWIRTVYRLYYTKVFTMAYKTGFSLIKFYFNILRYMNILKFSVSSKYWLLVIADLIWTYKSLLLHIYCLVLYEHSPMLPHATAPSPPLPRSSLNHIYVRSSVRMYGIPFSEAQLLLVCFC